MWKFSRVINTFAWHLLAEANVFGRLKLWCLKPNLSTLQVSSHGSLAADGKASVVQHTQEEQPEAENQTSWDCQCYACDLSAAEETDLF